MIRIERVASPQSRKAIDSLKAARERGGSYNTREVNEALCIMFHGKCYICEDGSPTSVEIEHLVPHRGNPDLKYSWDNLFWSCRHCNSIKGSRGQRLLDCTKEDVDEAISFVKEGYFGTEERLLFEPLDGRAETENTAKLLHDVYYGTTSQKEIEANILRKKVREELTEFKRYVRAFHEEQSPQEKEGLGYLVRKELSAGSPFAAFKRWLIRNNRELYPDAFEILEEVMARGGR